MKEHHNQLNQRNSKSERKAKLIESYQKAAERKSFEVKKEDFQNDMILNKLKKYLR